MDYIRINIFVSKLIDSANFGVFIPEEFISKVTIDYPFDSDLLVRDNSVEEYSDVKYVFINKSETQVLSFNLNQNDGSLYGDRINGSIPGLKGNFTLSNPAVSQSGRVVISTYKRFINLPYQDCIINIINGES
jgi:hypothetical protein